MNTDPEVALLLDELQSEVDFLRLRHSALEWMVEQLFARYMLQLPRAEAENFLTAISHRPRPAFVATEEGQQGVRPDTEAALWENIQHIAEKIRTRVREGLRPA